MLELAWPFPYTVDVPGRQNQTARQDTAMRAARRALRQATRRRWSHIGALCGASGDGGMLHVIIG
jgi:hypothetical protein